MPIRFLPLLLSTLMLVPHARAEPSSALRGLFCNSRDQLNDTIDRLSTVSSLETSVSITNREEVVCTFAYAISYVVAHPAVIDRRSHEGKLLAIYEAQLIGVQVGDNLRPISPALKIFFVPMDRLPDTAVEVRS